MNIKHITSIFVVLMLTVLCASAYVSVPTITDGIGFQYENITIGDDRIQINCTNITKEATFVIAPSNSLHKEGADYILPGMSDQITINSIISNANKGDKLLFLDGKIHQSAPITVTKAVTFVGQGHAWTTGGTIFYLDDSSNCDMFVVDPLGGDHIYFATFKNLLIHGNKAGQTSGNGISINNDCSDSIILNVGITETKEAGVKIQTGWLHSLINVWIEYCEGNGATLSAGLPKFTNCHISWNGERGINCGAGLQMANSKVTQNGKDGILFSDATTGVMLSNSVFSDNNQNDGGYGGLYMHGNTANVQVSNCFFNPKTGDAAGYGLKMVNTTTNNIVGGNIFEDYTTPLSIAAGANAGGHIRNNVGWVTENSGTDTLASGTTVKIITHGLNVTPTAGDIMVTAMESLGSASFFYIDTYTSTTFNITTNVDPTQDVDFAWSAAVY